MLDSPSPIADSDVPPPQKQHTWLRDIVEILLVALILYVIIWNALQTVRVDGHSMDTTLHDQDLLLASKISYKLGDPQRGDIVVLVPPVDPNKDFIKRVIAVPGDAIEINGFDGSKPAEILIKPGGKGDPQMLDEPYVANEAWMQVPDCCDSGGKQGPVQPTWVTLPPNQYFVMGDNRNHSEDSRYFGFVARDKILAKAFLRIWPLFHFGLGGGSTLVPAVSGAAALPLWWIGPRRLRGRHRRVRADAIF